MIVLQKSARTTPMPTLAELTHMYEDLPVNPPPLPRKRNLPSGKAVSAPKPSPPPPTKKTDARLHPFFLAGLLSYLPFYNAPAPPRPAPVKINPFMALRQGNKTIIIAVVDAGIVSFFRFGQGAFEEWPMA
jgi:tRNA-splicing endonuclease subunit Sen54